MAIPNDKEKGLLEEIQKKYQKQKLDADEVFQKARQLSASFRTTIQEQLELMLNENKNEQGEEHEELLL